MADNCIRRLYLASVFLLLGIIISSFNFQVIAAENLSKQKLSPLILQNEIVKEVNENPNAGWKASFNARFANATVAEFKRLLGVKPTPKTAFLGVPIVSHDKSLTLPKEFDARKTWSQCPSIARILDQGHCGACWAFGAVESLSDRFCIKYNINVSLSVNDLLACCGLLCGLGCNGGFPMGAWLYFKYHGVVTEECDPYFDKTGCSHPGCEPAYPTPKCERKCVSGNQLWNESKHYGVGAYKISSEPQDIMAEVYINGPVEVAFTVYEDFAHYKSGVYKHITGTNIGRHAAKLIGWGTSDDGEDYWLLANQWNRSWGDDGYFKIKRGTNECGIEHGVVAGLPSDRNVFKGVTTSDELLVSSF